MSCFARVVSSWVVFQLVAVTSVLGQGPVNPAIAWKRIHMTQIISMPLAADCMAYAPSDDAVVENELPKEALAILTQATELEVLSLDPNRKVRGLSPPNGNAELEDEGEPEDKSERFHGFRDLGKTRLNDAAERKQVVDAFLA